jgi:hypothetical protein
MNLLDKSKNAYQDKIMLSADEKILFFQSQKLSENKKRLYESYLNNFL